MSSNSNKNVFGTALQSCCYKPMTGYFRDGFCRTDARDSGTHVVCARMTEKFLAFTKNKGNDLSTPIPAYNFPGLKPGDQWCLCAMRWKEAMLAGAAPPVVLEATNIKVLEYIDLRELIKYAWKKTDKEPIKK